MAKFIVGTEGYIMHKGKVFKSGEEVELTDKQAKNVEGRVFSVSSNEGKQLRNQFPVDEQSGEEEEAPKEEAPKDDKKQTKQDK